MTHNEALICLNMVLDIGSIRLKKLLEVFGQPQEILKASPNKLMQASGIGGKIAHKISSLKSEDLENELKLAKKLGIKILTYEDNEACPRMFELGCDVKGNADWKIPFSTAKLPKGNIVIKA